MQTCRGSSPTSSSDSSGYIVATSNLKQLSIKRWCHFPLFMSLSRDFDGLQLQQDPRCLATACFASIRFATVSVDNLLECLVLMIMIFENIRSTAVDKCGKTNMSHMNSARIKHFALPFHCGEKATFGSKTDSCARKSSSSKGNLFLICTHNSTRNFWQSARKLVFLFYNGSFTIKASYLPPNFILFESRYRDTSQGLITDN